VARTRAVDGPWTWGGAAVGGAVEGVELMDQPLGMDPAQAVATDIELTGIVADDDGVLEQPMRLDAAPERPLGRDQHRIFDRDAA
jgi:hypothetical protein